MPDKKTKIMIVEDSTSDLMLIRHALTNTRIINEIEVAQNGEEALSMLREHHKNHTALPDLIFLDMNLPKLNGDEVLKSIKETENLKDIPVFIMAGSITEKSILRKKMPQADGFVSKPPHFTEIGDAIRKSQGIDHKVITSQAPCDTGTASWKKRYNDLNKDFENFAYVISHDLHAPLRQINGFTTILLDEFKGNLSDDQKLYRDMIIHALDQAEASLDIMLEFSRLNTDEKKFETASPGRIIDNALKDLTGKIEEKNASITIKDLPESINADHSLLRRAFYYILDNSLKFQPESRMPSIEISAQRDDTHTIFCIKDNGIGIPENQIEIAMTILRKLHTGDKYSGHGAGLTFAKKIAQIHGGKLWIESEIDKETSVYFSILN